MKSSYHHGDLASALVLEAVKQINSNGVDAVTLRSVCGALGVSQSATYHHFKNKDALLQAIAAAGERDLTRRFQAAILGLDGSSDRAIIKRFHALGRAYIEFAVEEPNFFVLTFGVHCALTGAPQDSESMGMLRHSITELAGRDLLRTQNYESLALMIWTSVHGFAHLLIAGLVSTGMIEHHIQAVDEMVLKKPGK
jgi:AcrR family transcriptional regulator